VIEAVGQGDQHEIRPVDARPGLEDAPESGAVVKPCIRGKTRGAARAGQVRLRRACGPSGGVS
jgi:hypothetical protein